MPKESARADRPLSISRDSWALTCVPNQRMVVIGWTVIFFGRLTWQGGPAPGVIVRIRTGTVDIGSRITDDDGNYAISFTPDWATWGGYACTDLAFRAIAPASGTSSPTVNVAIAFPTRISIEAPDRVDPGAAFTAQGFLEYRFGASVTDWMPIQGQTVTVKYKRATDPDVPTSWTNLGTSQTDATGRYAVSGSVSVVDAYTLRAEFLGQNLPSGHLGASSSDRGLATGKPQVASVFPWLALGSLVAITAVAAKRRKKR